MSARPPSTRRIARRGAAKIGRPSGSSGDETTARLVRAARAHFGEHGYAGARLTAIARDAGITHSSIYQYFASKHDLYVAVFEDAQAQLVPRYADAVASEPTLRTKLAAIFRASADVNRVDPSMTPFLASVPLELRRHPELERDIGTGENVMMAAMRAIFDEAKSNGEIPPSAADVDLLLAFVGAAIGIGLLSHGLHRDDMGPPLEIFLDALDGRFFRR